ncbi:MAG: hypothetical protein A2X35_00505 [Elusimicrobia bacterium GWA2_61_42]|nr:MAG: hypothetical protein A2X35_00505 [Elusimicrobia bacterium GWA2_61_42]OGR79207.1 MAG: hypothetical protein A2X38_06620 [Elusimicrobia bacterium GWC2_61_25]
MAHVIKSLLFAALIFPLNAAFAAGFNFETDPVSYFKTALDEAAVPAVPVPAGQPEQAGPKEWTVMLYAEGKSSAEGLSLDAVNMLEENGGSTDRVDYVAELSRMRGQFFDTPEDGDWTGARRYHIQKDDNFALIRSPVLQSFTGVNTGDWRHLADFIKWSKANFPAKRYALVILGHGSGWRDIARSDKGLAFDEETGRGIENPELARAIEESGGKLDLLVLNACLMQTAEALYDLKDSAGYIVGSENVMRGIPYERIVPVLNARPGMDAREAAKLFVEKHAEAYGGYPHQNPTLSAVDAGALNDFFALLEGWSRAAIKYGKKKIFRAQLDAAFGFDNGQKDAKDLGDLMRLVGANAQDPALAAQSAALSEFIRTKLTAASFGTDNRVSGVAAYMPAGKYSGAYDRLALAKATAWDDFLKMVR